MDEIRLSAVTGIVLEKPQWWNDFVGVVLPTPQASMNESQMDKFLFNIF